MPTLLFAALASGGCAGRGRLELVPLDYRRIDPPVPLSYLDLDRCYWWTDDSGQVWVALEWMRRPLADSFGPFVFQMSLALDELPAGAARDYTVGERELRALVRFGPFESRFVSSAGIVALYREPGEKLRGSFRLEARRQVTQWLGGWGEPATYLVQGTFTAVRDAARGRPIVAATESRGWERSAPRVEGVGVSGDAERSE